MKVIILTLVLFSNFTYANFVKTDMPFDMVAVGQDCYFKLVNNTNDYKFMKSVSLVLGNKGTPFDLDGYFIPDYKIPPKIDSIDVKENGDVLVYQSGKIKTQYHFKMQLHNKNNVILENENCIIKQGFVYKVQKD